MSAHSRAFHAVVRGRVQGVGFRYTAVRQARALGLRGTVANTPEGHVDVMAEGDAEKLAVFLQWLEKGPPGAWVRDVQVEWLPASGRYEDFTVVF